MGNNGGTFVDELKRILRDRNTNNIIVGFMLAFATVTFVQSVVTLWDGPGDYWLGQLTRQVISFIIVVVIVLYIARLAR
jgi:uncharacterized membrane protein